MSRKIILWKFLVNAALALATGWWATYIFEPTDATTTRLLYLISAAVFGVGYLLDIARKHTTLLPSALSKVISLERRSFHDMLARMSSEERLKLGELFGGKSGDAQTLIRIHSKAGYTSRWKLIARFIAVNLALAIMLVLLHAAGVWLFLPDAQELREIAQLVQLHFSKNQRGEIEFRGVVNDLYASGEQMSPALKNALVAREDKRFYDHWGFDAYGKLRAAASSSVYLLTLGMKGRLQGGSTLTEQLAKNLFLSGERGVLSGLRRKFKERVLAWKLEVSFSKDEMLEMYLNRVYFGRGAYGIETAARLFFDTQPEELRAVDPYQAALLIQSLPAPSAYNCASNKERAAREARKLLEQMGQTVDGARLDSAVERCHANGKRDLVIPEHRYLRDWIMSEITRSDYLDLLDGDFTVVTTMDARMQRFAERAIHDMMELYVTRGIFTRASLPQAAIVALSPNGAIRALMGGRDYGESQFSRVTQARRQPGSTFKLFVYLAALEQGKFTQISDQPDAKGWPSNGRHGHSPTPVSLRDALKESLNAAAVNTLNAVGLETVKNTARRLGVTSEFSADTGAALALGVSEVTPLEMTAAYAVFANGGFAVTPHGVLLARTKSGTIRYKYEGRHQRLVKAPIVSEMNAMLKAVVEDGTGKRAKFDKQIVGGKTGTTQGNSDAWFIGCTAYLCAGVWVGYDQSTDAMPSSVHGGSLPAEIFQNFMDKTHAAMQWGPKELP